MSTSASKAAPAAPIIELVGEKVWNVENHHKSDKVTLTDCTISQGVAVRNCSNLLLNVEKKVASTIIDNCSDCSMVFDSLIGSIEVVRSQRLKIQVLQTVPAISVDKTDGLDIYITRDSKDLEVTASHSYNVHINFPKGEDASGDWVELTIPEQFHHNIVQDKLVTRVSDLYSY